MSPRGAQRQLGPITVLHRLGHGGMGSVYVGFHLEKMVFVAVKTLFAELAEEPKVRKRFEQEGKIYSRLSHPNIVGLIDTGESTEESPAFLALEYVNGTSLFNLMQQEGPFPPGDVLEIVEDLAKALDHAHSRNIIHRDVKPQNILINQDATVKLVDFGVSRLEGTTAGVGTDTGQVLGTYSYAAPEQNQGKEVDQTADLYSLGVITWELLTGQRFVKGGSPPEVVLQQMRGPPAPPSAHVPGLPKALDEIVETLCQPYPEDRFRSAEDLCHALRTLRRDLTEEGEAEVFFGDDVHEKWTLARSAFANRQLSLASSLCKFITGRQEDYAPAHFMLGKIYTEKNLPVNAISSFQRALMHQPGNADYMLDFALSLFRLGRVSEAHREVMRLLAQHPDEQLALGFEVVIRRRLREAEESELAAADDLSAPLWFEADENPSLIQEAPPEVRTSRSAAEAARASKASTVPPERDGGDLPAPGVLSRAAARGLSSPADHPAPAAGGPRVSPEKAQALSRLLPGLGHWVVGARRQGAVIAIVCLWLVAMLCVLVTWSPEGLGMDAARVFLLLSGLWCLAFVWSRVPAEAGELALRRHLQGQVEFDLGDGQLRINLGSRDLAASGQRLRVIRTLTQAGGAPVELELGVLRLDRIQDGYAEGRFETADPQHPAPAPGDRVELA